MTRGLAWARFHPGFDASEARSEQIARHRASCMSPLPARRNQTPVALDRLAIMLHRSGQRSLRVVFLDRIGDDHSGIFIVNMPVSLAQNMVRGTGDTIAKRCAIGKHRTRYGTIATGHRRPARTVGREHRTRIDFHDPRQPLHPVAGERPRVTLPDKQSTCHIVAYHKAQSAGLMTVRLVPHLGQIAS